MLEDLGQLCSKFWKSSPPYLIIYYEKGQVNEYQDPANYSTSKTTSGYSAYTILNREKKSLFSASRLASCTDTVYHCLRSATFQKQTGTIKHSCFIKRTILDTWSTCLWWCHWMQCKSNIVLRLIHNVETIATYHSNMLSDDSTTLRQPATMFSLIISNKQKERWNIYT